VATLEQVQRWVALGESESQEFKLTTGQRSDAAKTLCAMLNKSGGRVLFGVNPAGKLAGQQVIDKTVEDVTAEIQQIEPPVFPSVERVLLENGLEVILVTTSQGSRRPYTYRGKSYKRVGNSTLEMTREEYNQMLLEQLHATQRWENEVAEGWTVDDLDTTEISRTLEEAIRRGRSEDPGSRDSLEILRGLGLLSRTGQLFRAAVVLFGREDRLLPDYPQCRLRLARFRGTDKTEFLDNKQFVGHAFSLLQRAERYLVENLPVAGRVIPTLFEREDDPLYPPVALREALANAFCHRDYSIGGGSVGVAIFDDRLEITSSGDLHFGLTVEDLYKPHESLPWNPLIAGVFYRRGIIETWGRGTLKMAELLHKAGLPRPDIEAVSRAVLVRFLPSRYVAPQRIGHDLSTRQQAILQLLGQGVRLLPSEIQPRVAPDATVRQIREDLSFLKTIKLVDFEGHGRGARWFLKTQGK
jgi:ATP-dependent DNA helicase RecG